MSETATEPTQSEALDAAALEAVKGLMGADNATEEDAEQPEATKEAEGAKDEEPAEDVSPQDAYLRRHLPASALKRMTVAERFEAYHDLREKELGALRRERGQGKQDSPSESPDTARESTADRSVPALTDAALSELLKPLEALSKDNGLDGFAPAISKPLQALAQRVSATDQALRKELSEVGQALQTLLRDRAVEGLRGKYPQIEGSGREGFERELDRQLKAESERGLKGLQAAAERTARIVWGTPTAAPSQPDKTKAKRTGQPTAPTGKPSAEPSKHKAVEADALEILGKHGIR